MSDLPILFLGAPSRPAWAVAGKVFSSPSVRWGGFLAGAAAGYLAAQGVPIASSWLLALPAMASCSVLTKRSVEIVADFAQSKSHGEADGFSDFCRLAAFAARQIRASSSVMAGIAFWPIRLAFFNNQEASSAATISIDAKLRAMEAIEQEKILFLGSYRCCEEAFNQLDLIDGLNTSISNAAPHLERLRELWTRGGFSAAQPDPREGRGARPFGPWARGSIIRFAKQATICPLSPEAETSLRSFIQALQASEESHEIATSIASFASAPRAPEGARRPKRL